MGRDAPERPPADLAELMRALTEHGVDFLVVGGVAAVAHGVPRFTLDLDILPSPELSNLERLAGALRALNARGVDPSNREVAVDLGHPSGLAVGSYFFLTDAGGLDLVNGPRPDLKRYRRLASRALDVDVAGTSVRVIGRDDLIRMKLEAGRDKDLRDVAAMTQADRLAREEAAGSAD